MGGKEVMTARITFFQCLAVQGRNEDKMKAREEYNRYFEIKTSNSIINTHIHSHKHTQAQLFKYIRFTLNRKPESTT